MDLTDKLSTWGATHAAARAAERAASTTHNPDSARLRDEARALRERADRLHSEILRAEPAKPR